MSEKIKTIEERVEKLKADYGHTIRMELLNDVRAALQEVARDQCHACAESLNGVHKINGESTSHITLIPLNGAHQAVMNANIGKEKL